MGEPLTAYIITRILDLSNFHFVPSYKCESVRNVLSNKMLNIVSKHSMIRAKAPSINHATADCLPVWASKSEMSPGEMMSGCPWDLAMTVWPSLFCTVPTTVTS